MALYNVRSQQEFISAMGSDREVVLHKEGSPYIWDRILKVDNLKLSSPDGAEIHTKKGFAFKAVNNCHFEGLTFRGSGGQFISLEGDDNKIINCDAFGGYRAFGISGRRNTISGGLIARATGNGIDINGGFALIPSISDSVINLQKAFANPDDYTVEQYAEIKREYFNKDLKAHVTGVTFYRCGYGGGNFTGGAIKAVPGAGGIIIEDCQDYFSTNSYWVDFPSTTPFIIRNNVSIGAVLNGIFVEGARKLGQATAIINDNIVFDAKVALFVSSFPDAITYGNVLAAREIPKKVHGIKPTNINRTITKSTTPSGDSKDILLATSPSNYRAHLVTHTSASYINEDVWMHFAGITPVWINSPNTNISGPKAPYTDSQMSEKIVLNVEIPDIDEKLRTPFTQEVSTVLGIPFEEGCDFSILVDYLEELVEELNVLED